MSWDIFSKENLIQLHISSRGQKLVTLQAEKHALGALVTTLRPRFFDGDLLKVVCCNSKLGGI